MVILLSSLIVPALSGLAFIAYKHPAAYKQLHRPLNVGTWAIWLLVSAWFMGYSAGFSECQLDAIKASHGKAAEFEKIWSWPVWAVGLLILWFSYLQFLYWLPSLLAQENKSQIKLPIEQKGGASDGDEIGQQHQKKRQPDFPEG